MKKRPAPDQSRAYLNFRDEFTLEQHLINIFSVFVSLVLVRLECVCFAAAKPTFFLSRACMSNVDHYYCYYYCYSTFSEPVSQSAVELCSAHFSESSHLIVPCAAALLFGQLKTELTADQVNSVPSYTKMLGGFVVCIFRLSLLRPSFFTNLMYADDEWSGVEWSGGM